MLYDCLADCFIKGAVKDLVLVTCFHLVLGSSRIGERRAGSGARKYACGARANTLSSTAHPQLYVLFQEGGGRFSQ